MKNNIIISAATGSGAISTTFSPGRAFILHGFTLRYSSNPTTSENLTLTLDAKDGTNYDTILYTLDPSASATRDILWQPEGGPLPFESGDGVLVAFTNTDARTYGLRIIAELL